MYDYQRVYNATLKYFGGNELATNVWMSKYALKDEQGNYLELTPDDMHLRMAREFAKVEAKYKHTPHPDMSPYGQQREKLKEKDIFDLFKDFKNIIPQGSVMALLGDRNFVGSLSNCVVISSPYDSYGGIMETDQQLTALMKRRCVSENTKVYVEGKGLVTISEVKVGDKVLSFNPETEKEEFLSVSGHWETEVADQDKIAILTESGIRLETSKKHPVLVLNKKNGKYQYITSGELSAGDLLLSPSKKPYSFSQEENENDLAWFVGAYLGCGNVFPANYKYNLHILAEVKEFVEKFVTIAGNITDFIPSLPSDNNREDSFWRCISIIDSNKEIGGNYFGGQTNKRPLSIFVPDSINLTTLPAFLAGLYDAAGHKKTRGNLTISSLSKALVEGIGERLAILGVSYLIKKYSQKGLNEKTIYILEIKDWDFIQEVLSHVVSPLKKVHLINPIDARTVGLSKGTIKGIPVKSAPRQLTKKNQWENNLRTQVVKEIVPLTKTTRYFDIEVEKNNNFFAGNGGLVVIHNCGVGFDISSLRPMGAPVQNAAKTSTGAVSFMHRFSNTTREVAQAGRRGALMITMDCRHPDILDFIKVKEDITKVTGANVSVMWHDDFMQAVINDEDYVLRWPVNVPPEKAKVTKQVRAKEVWNTAIQAAWACAEPGMIFIDTMRRYSVCDPYEKIISTNPCQPGWATVLLKEDKDFVRIARIDEIVPGDQIWSETGWVRVLNKWSTGIKPVYKYQTTGGQFVGTKDHRIVSKGIKVKAEHADTIDALVGPHFEGGRHILSAVMDGLVLGNGQIHPHLPEKIYLTIAKNDQALFNDSIKQLIIAPLDIKGSLGWEVNTTIAPKELPKPHKRKVPPRYFYGKSQLVASFLRGLYSAKGRVVGNRITLTSPSFVLIEQVQQMLSSLGIRTYYTVSQTNKSKSGKGSHLYYPVYNLNITEDQDKFALKIGFIQKHKMDKLALSKKVIVQNNGCKTHDIVNVVYLGDFEVFEITVDNNPHTYWTGGVNVSNCSEIGMGANDSCRLIASNIFGAVVNPYTPDAYFDHDHWYRICYEAQVLADNLVDLELEQVEKIIKKIEQDPEPDHIKASEYRLWRELWQTGFKGRRTGCGFTALGDTLAALGVKYDMGKDVIEAIMLTKFKAEWDATTDMAISRGAFPLMQEGGLKETEFTKFLEMVHPSAYERMVKYGRRNISISTVAPTGSLSLLAKLQNSHGTTSGIEPLFAPWYIRRKKVNPNEDVRVDFVDETGDCWTNFKVFHGGLIDWANTNGIEDIEAAYVQSPYYLACAPDIDWTRRVEIQGAVQRYVTHSISSTVNLPQHATVQDVGKIYLEAYRKGLKGITVYRDGSRSGVLITEKKPKITKNNAPKRPQRLPCVVFNTSVRGEYWVVLIGLLDGEPYEVFAYPNGKVNYTSGNIIKRGNGVYDLEVNDKIIQENIASLCRNDEQAALTRMISAALRHGTDAKFVLEQLDKSGGTVVDFSKAVARALRKGLNVKGRPKSTCPECGGKLVYEAGCLVCKDCGYTGKCE